MLTVLPCHHTHTHTCTDMYTHAHICTAKCTYRLTYKHTRVHLLTLTYRASHMVQMVKNLPFNAGDTGSIPGSGRSPGEGNGNPLQYSCLGNPMHRGAWWVTVQQVLALNNNTHVYTNTHIPMNTQRHTFTYTQIHTEAQTLRAFYYGVCARPQDPGRGNGKNQGENYMRQRLAPSAKATERFPSSLGYSCRSTQTRIITTLTILVPELNQRQSSQCTRCGHSQAPRGLSSQQKHARPHGQAPDALTPPQTALLQRPLQPDMMTSHTCVFLKRCWTS